MRQPGFRRCYNDDVEPKRRFMNNFGSIEREHFTGIIRLLFQRLNQQCQSIVGKFSNSLLKCFCLPC